MTDRLTRPIRSLRGYLTGGSGPRGRWSRRLGGLLALVTALSAAGFAYSALAPSSSAEDSATSAVNVQKGQELFDQTCISCHGENLQGVTGRGPSLIGVGQAAAYFQLSTGRMPLAAQGPDAPKKKPAYNETQIEQIAAYIQANGGGPTLPQGNLRDTNQIGKGGELFRLNCASCHSLSGAGGALSGGKFAPNLHNATDKQIYAAMLSGPGNMPNFSNGQISPQDKRALIAYLQNMKSEADPGGDGIGRLGPVPEGLVAWVVAIPVLLIFIFWIGAKVGGRGPRQPAKTEAAQVAAADPTRDHSTDTESGE